MSVQSWALPAPEPSAGWPRPLMADEFRGWPRGTLRNPTEAGQLLGRAVGFWDVASMRDGDRWLRNQGIGGSALDMLMGGSLVPSSNDPKLLTFDGIPYVYLPGASGDYLSVPDSAALDITGDIDIRVKVAMDDWTPAAVQVLLGKWVGGSAQRSYNVNVQVTGELALQLSHDGTSNATVVSSVPTGITDGSAKWVRVTYRTSDLRVQFFTSDDGVTWTQLGADRTHTIASIYSGSAGVEIGSINAGASSVAAGQFYRAQVYNGIAGTLVFDFDASVLTSGAATSCTEQSSNAATVTINRATSGRKTVCVTQPCWLFGTDDYLEVAHSPLLDFLATDSFTIGTWVRMWATPTNNGSLASKRDSSGAGWKIRSNGTGYGPAGVASDGTNTALPTGPASSAGVLAVLSMVVDRATQTSVAYTGASAGTAASLSAVASLASPGVQFRVGRDGGSGTNYQDFELTRAAIWREALTARDIATLAA